MSLRKSIRWRIQAWHGVLLLVLCTGFGVTAYRLEKSNAQRHFDQELELRLSALSNALSSQGGGPPGDGRRPPREGREGPPGEEGPPPHERPEGPPDRPPRDGPRTPPGFRSLEVTSLFDSKEGAPFYYQAWTRRKTVMDKSSTAPPRIPQPVAPDALEKAVRTRDGFRECYVFTPPGECLLVGRSTAGLDREMLDFGWKLTGIGAAVLASGLAVGWWIATRALRPVSEISAAASRIAGGNLKERIRTSETESELGRLASLLDDTFGRLDAAFEEQARFTSDAAHELRTPVSIILAQTQLALAKDRSAGDYRETIEMSQRAAKRMHALIESLLQLSVIDAAGRELTLHAVDLKEVASEQIALMETLAAEKNISLVPDLSSAPCMANAEHIGQIVINLLTNAVKFSSSGSEIRIRTGLKEGWVFLGVEDDGPGIPAHHLPHLFERFYRVESSRNRATGGAGLGLAICQRIAEAHGGLLTVESEEGKGSVFTLTIPREVNE